MDHRIPKVGVVICIVLAAAALVTFIFLNNRFQGPNPVAFISDPYELTVRFKDNKTLPTKQAVLYEGKVVGKVTQEQWEASRRESRVTFTLDDGFTLRKDAAIRIGYRSLLGDPYLAVDTRGSKDQPELQSGGEVTRTKTTVDFDEALAFLDSDGRDRVRSLIKTVAEATTAPGNGERLNGTLGGVARTVNEVHVLTKTLRGQEREIAELVRSASTVLSTIGDREASIERIVGAGRTTLDSLASNTRSLEQGIDELPRLLSSGRASLAGLRPLLAEAGPAFAQLRRAAPDVAAAVSPKAAHPLNGAVNDLVAIVRGLGPLNKQASPVLRRLKVLLDDLLPVVRAGAPGARNLVPALDYLTPRSKAIATGYALLAAALNHRDARGHYGLVGLQLDPNEQTDGPASGNSNAYPGPGDALDPQPFTGSYPRIIPCTVPSRKTPKAPCK